MDLFFHAVLVIDSNRNGLWNPKSDFSSLPSASFRAAFQYTFLFFCPPLDGVLTESPNFAQLPRREVPFEHPICDHIAALKSVLWIRKPAPPRWGFPLMQIRHPFAM